MSNKKRAAEPTTPKSEDDDSKGICEQCLSIPCVLEDTKDSITASFDAVHNSDPLNKHICFKMYKTWVANHYGFLGKNHRIKIPDCVVEYIRELAPEPDGKYTGYHEVGDSQYTLSAKTSPVAKKPPSKKTKQSTTAAKTPPKSFTKLLKDTNLRLGELHKYDLTYSPGMKKDEFYLRSIRSAAITKATNSPNPTPIKAEALEMDNDDEDEAAKELDDIGIVL